MCSLPPADFAILWRMPGASTTNRERKTMRLSLSIIACLLATAQFPARPVFVSDSTADFTTEIKQITYGPKHHFFGYIGHVRTIPWNQSGRFIVALQTHFQERMPAPGEAADIILLDTRNNF